MTSGDRLILLATSPRLPPGLLSGPAWSALRAHPVYGDPTGAQTRAIAAAGVIVHPAPDVLGRDPGPPVRGLGVPAELARARALRDLAAGPGTVVWILADDADPALVRAVGDLVARSPGEVILEVLHGSWDPPGARLLDVVAVLDRLRSPGGCPWDAAQTHDSLRGYLLEETYEAYDALVDGDLGALREELGDVLLQVAFHARLAEEAEPGWGIDEVAADLVAKLVRRHPHVFADTVADSAGAVEANWESIKKAEKGRTSVTEGLSRSQPALALATALVRRARRAGLPLPAAAPSALGHQLLDLVVRAQESGSDPEAELRAAADAYAEVLRGIERPTTG